MAGIRERKYKSANGKIKSYFEISWYKNGKQFKKGGFKSKIDAQIELSKFITTDVKKVNFNCLAKDYLECHCTLHCKEATKKLYESYLNNNLDTIKNKNVNDIKKKDVEMLILQLKEAELTNKTINCIITFIQAVLNYGVDNEIISINPIARFKKLPIVKDTPNFLNDKQIEVFMEVAKETKYYAFFATALFTGMRISEISGLEWSDIDFKKKKITVNKQIYRGVKQSTKTNKERVIDIPDTLLEILQEHKSNNTYLSKLVFHNGNGAPVHIASMKEYYFHPVIKKCNELLDVENQITNFRFHDLRHTYATFLLSNGVPVKYVQEQLGHSSARMTLDVYSSVMPSVKFEAINLLNSIKKEHKKNIENKNSMITSV